MAPLAEQGNVFAQTVLAIAYSQGRIVPLDFKEAEKWFRSAADQSWKSWLSVALNLILAPQL
jgi:TPR repeat protein